MVHITHNNIILQLSSCSSFCFSDVVCVFYVLNTQRPRLEVGGYFCMPFFSTRDEFFFRYDVIANSIHSFVVVVGGSGSRKNNYSYDYCVVEEDIYTHILIMIYDHYSHYARIRHIFD